MTITLRNVLHASAHHFGVSVEQMQSSRRPQSIVAARQSFCVIARSFGKWSFNQIGRAIAKDHTTVVHAVQVRHVSQADRDSVVDQARRLSTGETIYSPIFHDMETPIPANVNEPLSPLTAAEMMRAYPLRRRGWSVKSIAKYTGIHIENLQALYGVEGGIA
jgi:hypothetical protein